MLLMLWLASLALPVATAAIAGQPTDFGRGWMMLCIGWLGIAVGQFGWFANIVFLISLYRLMFCQSSRTANLVLLSALVATTFDALFWHTMYGDDRTAPIQAYGSGYYIWFAAMSGAALSLAAAARMRR